MTERAYNPNKQTKETNLQLCCLTWAGDTLGLFGGGTVPFSSLQNVTNLDKILLGQTAWIGAGLGNVQVEIGKSWAEVENWNRSDLLSFPFLSSSHSISCHLYQ